jgi:4-hydroxy-3-methylbut-2-enyl diphosphate reductase
VSPEVRRVCEERSLRVIDATCPLVSKVHAEVRRYAARGATVLLVGHGDHDEVIGTRGEAPDAVILVESVEDAETVEVADPDRVALTTQTTLSIDDTTEIVGVLKRRFPALMGPKSSDICYATQNRQDAVRETVRAGADLVLVVGSKNSSNSLRLVEVALRAGARDARLVDDATQVDWSWLDGVSTLGITAGASAPEPLIEALVDAVRARFDAEVIEDAGERETVTFKLPRVLTTADA